MREGENNKKPLAVEPSLLAGYIYQGREDQIDLVDLWIVMWAYRKLILSSLVLVAVIGILCFELFYNVKPASKVKPASTVRSVIEIETIKRIPVVDPDVLIKRIEFTMLPRISSLSEFAPNKRLIMTTSASRISNGSNIVVIANKIPDGKVADISRFHDQLVEDILQELKESAVLLTANVHDAIFKARKRIIVLDGSKINLERELLAKANSQNKKHQERVDELTLRKTNIQSEIDLLTQRIEYLELQLLNTGSRVLLKAQVLEKPLSSSNRTLAYSVIVMISIFFAALLTMGVIFARKVKERMAAEG